MGYTNFPNGITSMGSPVVGFPTQGKVFFLDPANGSDSNDGKNVDSAFLTLAAAHDAMTANQNDILYYLAGGTALTLPAGGTAFDWSKALCHFIGICAPTQVGQRARIFNTAGTNNEPMITISGNGCHWENIYAFNGVADAGALTCVAVTADYGSMRNCQFVGGGSNESAIDDNSSLYMNGSANYTYEHCIFGAQSIPQGAGTNVLRFGTTAGGQNIFRDCVIHMYASSTSATLVEILAGNSCDRWVLFEDCMFYNWGPNSLGTAFTLAATGNGRIFLKDCVGLGFDKWDSGDSGVIYGNMGDGTGTDTSGFLLQLLT